MELREGLWNDLDDGAAFEVLTAVVMKILSSGRMAVTCSSKMPVDFQQTTDVSQKAKLSNLQMSADGICIRLA
jgi:hypothetical protein